ncbi:MAG: hypothetical protein HC768_24090 [Acaryochloris sp. CRU_2_0]|nr:hypothetical protein [Acaryochloris sp. CRU_2_0]
MIGSVSQNILVGRKGDDYLQGGNGNDVLLGNRGNDVLSGDQGRDRLMGGKGNDVLIGGAGVDILQGGRGHDRFVVTPEDGSVDQIKDFAFGFDSIVLEGDLTFFDLTFIQNGSDTNIQITATNEPLLQIANVAAGEFSWTDFEIALPNVDQITVFGDSYSDTGNFSALTGEVLPPPFFEGRLSNGPIWVDILGERLAKIGVPVQSFAVAGATSGRDNANDDLPGLLDQIDAFIAQTEPSEIDADDVFILFAGGDGPTQILEGDGEGTPEQILGNVVANLSSAITTLAQAGAEQIAVVNVPNAGILPIARELGASALATELSVAVNTLLETALPQLEQGLGIDIIEIDAFSRIQDVVLRPDVFGFTDITTPLITAGNVPNPQEFLFFDDVHPTTQGHAIFADFFQATITQAVGIANFAFAS